MISGLKVDAAPRPLPGIEFRQKPYAHQAEEFTQHGHAPFRALFWEQGLGKSMEVIAQAAALFSDDRVGGLLVLAPDAPATNWITDELPKHLPTNILNSAMFDKYISAKSKTKGHAARMSELLRHRGFSALVMSYDGFMTDVGKKTAWAFMKARRPLYVLDESARIKNPAAKRTKSIVASGKQTPLRRILSGTPVANGPFDVYSQMKFLKDDFWVPHNLNSFAAFKSWFGIWEKARGVGGREFDMLVGYRRLGELEAILEPHSSRLLKEDVLDLPPKLYSKRYFEMTPTQDRMYQQLRDEYLTMMERPGPCEQCEGTGKAHYNNEEFFCDTCNGSGRVVMMVSAPLAITRLLRLQQILCGYVPDEMGSPFHDIPGGNPRLDLLLDTLEDVPHKAIVWARFRRDIDQICAALGDSAVRYDGTTSEEDRRRNKERFQNGDAKFFVANPSAAGEGLTLHAARTVVYYNNSFKLTDRLQSEDRAHRIGQNFPVHYIDLVCPGTIDVHVTEALIKKMDIASQVLGDKFKEWLRDDVNA